MPVNPVTSTNSTDNLTLPDGAKVVSGNSSQLGQQDFLKLLTTEMTNQDPLQPQDQTQMLAQLAQFSTVEGLNNVVSSQTHQQATDLLGKTVDAILMQGNTPKPVSGKVNGVRWAGDGIHLSLDGVSDDVMLGDVQQVSGP